MTTVLITGSEGQLGQCFIKRFLALDYKVIAFDIKNSKQIKQVNYFKVDITKKQQVETALKHIECVDILINNAGAQVFTDFTVTLFTFFLIASVEPIGNFSPP